MLGQALDVVGVHDVPKKKEQKKYKKKKEKIMNANPIKGLWESLQVSHCKIN